ncbi:MAG: translation initiation factor IF-3 [Christensenellales bacterium]
MLGINVDLLINEQIVAREVRLIGENGEQMGILPTSKAMDIAEQKQLDLVCIAPQGKPPVCKVMDYGKYRFELLKKHKEAKKNQKIVSLKEVRLSATIDQHDLDVKSKNARKFLLSGDKVKVSIRFRGRQVSHSSLGLEVMKNFFKSVEDVGHIERQPKMEGRNMFMILAPNVAK